MGSNSILTKDNMTEVIPKWQHPILPGRAVQGSLLFTTTDFINPPQSAADFTWIAMEEICGIHDTKCYYDEKDNVYHFYKSIGHLNNDETWAEDWYEFATVQGISKEAQEMLEAMEYIVYKFNQEPTEFGTHFTVVGVRKDATEETICDMYLPDKDYIDRQDLYYQPIDGTATSINQTADGREVNVVYNVMKGLDTGDDNDLYIKIDNDTVKFNNQGELISDSAIADELTIHKDKDTHIISVIPNEDKAITTSDKGVEVKIDNDTINFTENGELHAKGDIKAGTATYISEEWTEGKGGAAIVNVEYNESKGLIVNDSNQLEVPIDDTLRYNPDGSLHAIGDIRDGIATHIGSKITTGGTEYKDVDVLYDVAKGLTVNGDNQLEVKKDYNKGLEFNNNGELAVKVDELKGLTFNDDDGKLATKITGEQGLEFDEDGNIKAKVDGATVRIDDYGRLEAVPVEVREGKAIDIRKVEDEGDPYYVVDAIGDGTTIGYTANSQLKVIPNTDRGITTSNKGVEAKIGQGLFFGDNVDGFNKGTIHVKLQKHTDSTLDPLNVDAHGCLYCGVDKTHGLMLRTDATNKGFIQVNDGAGLNIASNGALQVNADRGINIVNDKVGINANFTTSTEPLGTNPSNIILHSDGKIEVEGGTGNPDNLSIELNPDEELKVKLRQHSIRGTNTSGLEVNTEPSSISSTGLYVNCGRGMYLDFNTNEVQTMNDLETLGYTEDGMNKVKLYKRDDITSIGDSGLVVEGEDTESGDGERGLKVNTGAGLEIDTSNHVNITSSKGITIDSEGVAVNTNFAEDINPLGTQYGGLALYNDNKVGIATNFIDDTRALGDNVAGFVRYSDGKIGVKSALKLDLITECRANNTNRIEITGIENINNYDMLNIQIGNYNKSNNTFIEMQSFITPNPKTGTINKFLTAVGNQRYQATTGIPQGMNVGGVQVNIDLTNKTGHVVRWSATSFLSDTGLWSEYIPKPIAQFDACVRLSGLVAG